MNQKKKYEIKLFGDEIIKEAKKQGINTIIDVGCGKGYLTNYISSPNIFHLYLFLGAISSLLLINFYNNKKGKNIKYLLYIFYPLHLIILVILKS